MSQQGDKAYADFKGALVKASSKEEGVNIIFAETEGNNGALEYFGLKEEVGGRKFRC